MPKQMWQKMFVVLCFCVVTAIASPAQIFRTFLYFDETDGFIPSALVQGPDGNFYGTTEFGGSTGFGAGTVFKITPVGKLTTVHVFQSCGCCDECPDGHLPVTSVVLGTDGNFYGTTLQGGGYIFKHGNTDGTVFKLSPEGKLTRLHSFDGTDGSAPSGALMQAIDGNFYGTTSSGGANGDGTVFQITPEGTLTTLHSFAGADGESPSSSLVQATDGSFYGTTPSGGTYGGGTVFKITPDGTFMTLYNFCRETNCADGNGPSMLMQASDGNFYGVTLIGGATVTVEPYSKLHPGAS
jgi:uncharacterized repeat protein (TIGR03803 family)